MADSFHQLAGDKPDAPVTRTEVVRYVAQVIVAERLRMAGAFEEFKKNPEMLLEAIGDSRLDPNGFAWPE